MLLLCVCTHIILTSVAIPWRALTHMFASQRTASSQSRSHSVSFLRRQTVVMNRAGLPTAGPDYAGVAHKLVKRLGRKMIDPILADGAWTSHPGMSKLNAA